MGCIRKRRGKWVADYRDPSGRRRWITRDTRKEAETALAAVKVAIDKDEYVAPDNQRTLQTIYDHCWRVAVVGTDNKRGKPLSAGTQGFYAGLWTRYLHAPSVDIADVLFGSKTVAADEKEETNGGQDFEKSPENLGAWSGGPWAIETVPPIPIRIRLK
jgi:hypothetical protein